MEGPAKDNRYQLIIVGGGAAALSAGIYAARKMLKALLVSRELGGQVMFSSDVENYLGFPSIRGMELFGKFEEHLRRYEIDISVGETAEKIEKEDGEFRVFAEGGKSWIAETVIIATGARWRRLNVPGEKELVGRGVSYCATCDGPLFRGKKVAVVGGGNSGMTAVNDLVPIADRVYLVEVLETLQADPVLVDRVKGSEKLEVLLHHKVEEVGGSEKGVEGLTVRNLASGEGRMLQVDGVFVEIGTVPNSAFVEGLVEINPRKEIVTDSHARTSVPGIFAAGDVTAVPQRQIIIAAGQGANAALCAYEYLLKRQKSGDEKSSA